MKTVELIGLTNDDGADEFNPRKTLSITRGEDMTIRLTLRNPSGAFITTTGSTFALTVKKKATDSQALIAKTGTVGDGASTFTIDVADTKKLDPGRYVYDIWSTLGGKRSAVVPLSTLILESNVVAVP